VQVKELIQQSWDALTRNRLRSILTMMGIVWGLTTVVLLLGYGQSVSAGVLNAFLGIGNNVIMVWEGQTSMQAGGQRAGKRIHFKYEDVEAIREEAPLVRMVSAEWDDPVAYKYGDRVVTVQSKAVQYPTARCANSTWPSRFFEESDLPSIATCSSSAQRRQEVFGNRIPWANSSPSTAAAGKSSACSASKSRIHPTTPRQRNFFMPFESMSDINDRRDPEMIVFQASSPCSTKPPSDKCAKSSLAATISIPRTTNPLPSGYRRRLQRHPAIRTRAPTHPRFIGTLTLGVGGVA